MLRANRDLNLLATRFLPGKLVQGDEAEDHPDTYRQAGHLLAQLHQQAARTDPEYETSADVGVLTNLEKPHRIDADTVRNLRRAIAAYPGGGARVVPTHGDYQPRNWLVHEGTVTVIDFGRAQWRPDYTDFARLAAQQLRGRPDLERAFLTGYGHHPRHCGPWQRYRLRKAVGTAVWAYQVGDEGFEAQGHRMIDDALAVAGD